MTYYKFLGEDGRSTRQGFEWPLPTEDGPGEWVEVDGDLVECRNGLHACRPRDLVFWIGARLYVLEFDGEVIDATEKVYGRRARLASRVDAWNERSARLFAADCAEHVAHLWQKPAGCDWEPSHTLDVVRRYANGEATKEELRAARDAAGGAERDWQTTALLNRLGLAQ